MKILILEDEKPNFLRLQQQLKLLSGTYEIIGPVETVAAAKSFLKDNMFDLIIADICLSDGLVFEAFDSSPVNCSVIFTTAYDEYAIRAFKYNGISYLLKPVSFEELESAISKVQNKSEGFVKENLDKLFTLLHKSNLQYRQRFLISDADGYSVVEVEDISFIFSEGGLTRLFLKDKRKLVVEQTLDELVGQLDPALFFRANRQHIININSIKRLGNWFNRKIRVFIKEYPEQEIIVSKEKTAILKLWIDS